MLAHYSHVRLEAKRNALEGLSDRHLKEGHVTIDVTNEAKVKSGGLQLVENMVDVTRIEPATPCLQSRADKTLNALSGVAYKENRRSSRSADVPKLYRNP